MTDGDWTGSFAPDIGVLARAAIYLCSLYAAYYYALSSQGPSSRKSSTNSIISSDESLAELSNPQAVRLSCIPLNGPRFRTEPGMAIDELTGNVIIHGGDSRALLADINVLSFDNLDWEQFPVTPNDRQRFGMVMIPKGKIVVFGGRDKQHRANDVVSTIVFSSKAFDWADHESDMQKPWPAARYGHAMCLCEGNQIAVFGGYDSSGKQLTDLWLLDVTGSEEKPAWTKVGARGYVRPKARKKPSIAHLDDRVFLFGQTPRSSRGMVELFRLSNRQWERQVSCGDEPIDQNCQVHRLRKTAKLVAVSNEETTSCGLFNRLDVLDTLTKPMTWSRVDLSWRGDYTMIPGTHHLFSSAMDSAGLMYIFGGMQGESSDKEEEGREYLDTLIVANFSPYFASEDMDG